MIAHRLASRRVAAAIGGFGLAGAALFLGYSLPDWGDLMLTVMGAAWLVAAFTVGALYPRHWATAGAGVVATIGVLILFDAGLIGVSGGEWSGYDKAIWRGSLAFGAVLGFAIVGLGALLPFRRGKARRLARFAFILGGVATVAAVMTLAILSTASAHTSFVLPLAPGWNTLARATMPWGGGAAHGNSFTAVYESEAAPPRVGWPAKPVVGVSVHRGSGRADSCFRSADTWAGDPSPLYEAEVVDFGPVVLPVGVAYHEVRRNPEDDSRIYGYGIVRDRSVGILTEPLCYLVVVTLPSDSGMTAADAIAIVEGFRFQ